MGGGNALIEKANTIRVLVVDDHLVVRQGFATLLRAFPDIDLIGEAQNGKEAITACDELCPDVILMDMIMPQMNGANAIEAIRQKHPEIQIIAMTSYSDDKQLVQAAIEAGAIGYLFKDVSISELAHAIRSAYQHIPILDPNALHMLIQAKAQRTPADFNLSDREMEVLALLAEGLVNQDISERLSISLSTVKFHVSSILHKLGASTRTEAVTLAYQHKLVE